MLSRISRCAAHLPIIPRFFFAPRDWPVVRIAQGVANREHPSFAVVGCGRERFVVDPKGLTFESRLLGYNTRNFRLEVKASDSGCHLISGHKVCIYPFPRVNQHAGGWTLAARRAPETGFGFVRVACQRIRSSALPFFARTIARIVRVRWQRITDRPSCFSHVHKHAHAACTSHPVTTV